MTTALDELRTSAVARAGFGSSSLAEAVLRMGFIQFDPLRCPTTAQDLVLRQRVREYRAGALHSSYGRLGLEEGHLNVYGAMTAELASLSDPRADPDTAARQAPTGFAADVLDVVAEHGHARAADVATALGGARVRNAWGGRSRATTCTLEELHRWGWLRVRQRDRTGKIYTVGRPLPEPRGHVERADRLTCHLASSLAPVTVSTLRGALAQLARRGKVVVGDSLTRLRSSGRLVQREVDGVPYIEDGAGTAVAELARNRRRGGIRLLAPFDPLVWDRRRFEHLWGWPYRFEAYTPISRRRYGYYTLPMLRGDSVVGWAQCSVNSGRLDTHYALISGRSADRRLRLALDVELSRMATSVAATVGTIDE